MVVYGFDLFVERGEEAGDRNGLLAKRLIISVQSGSDLCTLKSPLVFMKWLRISK